LNRQKREAFPAGLYGMLLFALCCLTLPGIFAPVERALVGGLCLLPRAVSAWAGIPAQAAAEPRLLAQLRDLTEDLHTRVRQYDLEVGAPELLRNYEPVLCGVVASERRGRGGGGGGQPSELRLDHSYAELADCCEFVTKGNVLLGFLQKAGRGEAAEDPPEALARVLLLNHASARSVAAVVNLPEGGSLRMVVKPAAAVDPAPLRVDLWDDPYRAANLDRPGLPVTTIALPSLPGEPPAGLWLGRTRIWGYEAAVGEDALTIGVFVVPPFEPRALSHVVAWRRRADSQTAPAPESPLVALRHQAGLEGRHAAYVWDLPGAVHGRHLLSCDGPVPDGAAVVQDGICLGTARGLAFGLGLVTSFPASRQRWNLLLLPQQPGLRPREITGQVVGSQNGIAILQWRGDSFDGVDERLPAGYLFTGSNGPHCPPGLFLGYARSEGLPQDRVEVTTASQSGPRTAEVVVGGGGR
jgi:hypothetical protein